MTIDEAKAFFKHELFAAFPGVLEWAVEKSPNIEATIGLWAKSLAKVTLDECRAVLDAWIDGSVPPPESHQRDGFVLHLRACVMESRRKKLASQPLQEQRKHLSEGQSIMEGIRSSKIWRTHWEPLRVAVLAGDISRESALSQWNAIIDEEFAKAAKGKSWNG